jgi:hypothetical protein
MVRPLGGGAAITCDWAPLPIPCGNPHARCGLALSREIAPPLIRIMDSAVVHVPDEQSGRTMPMPAPGLPAARSPRTFVRIELP